MAPGKACTPAHVAFSVFICFAAYTQSSATQPIHATAPTSEASMDSVGEQLREAIQDKYRSLGKNGELSGRLEGNDISEVVLRYIPTGTPFGRAESLLQTAGLKVAKRPGPQASGKYPYKYDVFATSHSVVGGWFTLFKPEVVVQLTPDSPATYSTVAAVRARITNILP